MGKQFGGSAVTLLIEFTICKATIGPLSGVHYRGSLIVWETITDTPTRIILPLAGQDSVTFSNACWRS